MMGLSCYFLALLLTVLLLSSESDANSKNSAEGRVIDIITQDYEPRARPVKDPKRPVYVNMTISLNQIISLDEIDQVFNSKIWFRMVWIDEYLQWNTSDYDGVDMVALRPDDIWRPDIFSYNSLNDERPGYVFDEAVSAQVYSDGTVIWVPSAVMSSSCSIDVTDYPFDRQKCLIKFGTWTYDMDQVVILMPSGEMNDPANIDFLNGEWRLDSCPCKAMVVGTFGQQWSVVECYVNIIREPLFYIVNLGFPIILLLAIGGLAFCLPPDSGDKINLSITIFLALTVFIMVLMDHLPSTSQAVPLLEKFIAGCTVLLAVSTGCAVIVVSVHTRPTWKATRPPPRLMQICLLKAMAKLVCMDMEYMEDEDDAKLIESGTRAAVPTEEEQEAAHKTWIKCALVMDRICCVLYVSCTVIIFFWLIIKAYNH
jgi:cation transporter family protein